MNATREQQAVIDAFGQGVAVTAGAGSGKTTTLVRKCEAFLERNPDSLLCAVSFTERSASDLRLKLVPKIGSDHWITTIHGLCGNILREFPQEAGFDGEERILSDAESRLIWEQACEGLWREELPKNLSDAFGYWLERETQDEFFKLLLRVKAVHSFGAFDSTPGAHDKSRLIEDPDLTSLLLLGDYVLSRYRQAKRRRGVIDFDDMEQGARRALRVRHVRESYQSRFGLLIVDEFQDTNPVQAEVIEAIAKPELTNICVVGDPKQSIYRFRDADVSVFEAFCQKLPVRLSLSRNFRSHPEILEFVNAVCEPAFQASELTYEALEAGREHSSFDSTIESRVLRLDWPSPTGLHQDAPGLAGGRALGRWLRGEVARGYDLSDFALLLRKVRGQESWFRGLLAAGIPVAVGSGGFFWEEPRVREMVAFLKWWVQPKNVLSGVTFLRSPWASVSDEVLDEWVRSGALRERFLQSDHPLARALSGFLTPSGVLMGRPGEWLQALLVSPEIEAELGVAYLGLWHRVEDLSARGFTALEVLRELSLALEEQRREKEVPPPQQVGVLPVMTIHGAKGLEFKHVILLDFMGKRRTSPAPLLFWDREFGVSLGVRTDSGERDTKAEAQWRERERKKELAESRRVFYVALTRAQERLILVTPTSEPSEKKAEKQTELSTDDWREWIDTKASLGRRVDLGELQAPTPLFTPGVSQTSGISPRIDRARWESPLSLARSRHSVTEWNEALRCERSYEWNRIRPPSGSEVKGEVWELGEDLESPSASTQSTGLSTRELGTEVHDALAREDWEKLKHLEQAVGSERLESEALIRWAQNSELMRHTNADWVSSELSFEVPVGREVLVGSMDRIRVRMTGDQVEIDVIDFKLTQSSKTKAELEEAYGHQLALYAEAARLLARRSTPDAKPVMIRTWIVAISGSTVESFALEAPSLDLETVAQRISNLLNGTLGRPTPGPLCRVCSWRPQCPEALG